MQLLAGTVTFLMTDIEGSTTLWSDEPDAMGAALARHDEIAARVIVAHGGVLVKSKGEGDSLFAVFPRASDAVAAAHALQLALHAEPWGMERPIRVRMGLHTGEAELRDGDYFGMAPSRCARLRSLGHGGQILLSATTAELVRDALPEGASLLALGTYQLRHVSLPEQVHQLVHPQLPAGFPPLRTPVISPHNLPVQSSSFVGRGRELAELRRLAASHRLVTLTGAGGSGKTRLALQIAEELVDRYPDGVWFVELAPLQEPLLVPQVVAKAAGLREETRATPTETLIARFRSARVLLVIDNCEHLVHAVAVLISQLLQACPQLSVIATSREPLSIPGELRFRVPSLSLPDPRRLPEPEQLQSWEAVRLFIDRALAVNREFAVTNRNAPALVELCHRLDGIPMAIELAAARVRLLSVEEIAARVGDRFRLLTGGNRTVLPRHQTLRALFDWSYGLLLPQEQQMFRWLSVFAGGFTLQAAEMVCTGEGIEEFEVLDLLAQLDDKSLVVVQQQEGETRYRMLETLREYGLARLRESGEEEALRRRHSAWVLDMAEQAAKEMETQHQGGWYDRLEREHDNLRSALAWAQTEQGDIETGLRIATAVELFWRRRDHDREGLQCIERLLEVQAQQTAETGRALLVAGYLAGKLGQPDRMRTLCRKAREISERAGDREGLARALYQLALRETDVVRREALFEESLVIYRTLNTPSRLLLMLVSYVLALWRAGKLEQAWALVREGEGVLRHANDVHARAALSRVKGYLVWSGGDAEEAERYFRESLAITWDLRDRHCMADSLRGLSQMAAGRKAYRPAARLHGMMLHLHESLGNPWRPVFLEEEMLAEVQTALGAEAFAAEVDWGRRQTDEDAFAYGMLHDGF